SHFSPERWREFKQDVAWFRAHRTPQQWSLAFVDHGYNATPVWGIAGTLLSHAPVSDHRILALSLIDPALILVMWAFVWWAFGWRTMCVALIWWGANYPARFLFTGGALLRADWLAFLVIGVCLVRRGLAAAGGFAVTWSALLRIFPGVVVLALCARALLDAWRGGWRGVDPAIARFVVGCAVAVALLVPISFFVVGGGI